MKIVIGNDHAAIELKSHLLEHLGTKTDIVVTDIGANDRSGADYPEYAYLVAKGVTAGEYDYGLLLCGTGAGMCIAANKVNGIRAVVCSDTYTAHLSREHNDANILCMGARVVGSELAKSILDAFLDAEFKGGRHRQRVEKVMEIEDR